ncbi:MAG: hypothetical protein ACI9HK_005663 [Pirellulaceae bacterium]|jgi:hypothetical protein
MTQAAKRLTVITIILVCLGTIAIATIVVQTVFRNETVNVNNILVANQIANENEAFFYIIERQDRYRVNYLSRHRESRKWKVHLYYTTGYKVTRTAIDNFELPSGIVPIGKDVYFIDRRNLYSPIRKLYVWKDSKFVEVEGNDLLDSIDLPAKKQCEKEGWKYWDYGTLIRHAERDIPIEITLNNRKVQLKLRNPPAETTGESESRFEIEISGSFPTMKRFISVGETKEE